MAEHRQRNRKWTVLAALLAAAVVGSGVATMARAESCALLLGAFQQGASDEEIAQATGFAVNDVSGCRRELSRPIFVGPSGVPPVGAAGVPPRGSAIGPPPSGSAVGPPPIGGPGPAPVGREVRRLP